MKVTEAMSEPSAAPKIGITKVVVPVALRKVVAPALLLAAALLWLASLPEIDPRRMNDFGLVSVLPVSFLVALSLLALSFALTLGTRLYTKRQTTVLLIAEIVLLILVLYGTPAFVEEVPRTGTLWRHLGIVDYIARHGSVDRTIDAYFNWPGAFIAMAFMERVTGLDSLAGIAAWASVFFNLLYAFALLALFRFGFREERPAWLAVWVFLCTNWIGQDILSPQAFGYVIYLNILMVLVFAFPAAQRRIRLRNADGRTRSGRAMLPRLRRLAPGVARRISLVFSRPKVPRGAAARWSTSDLQRLLLALTVLVLFTAVAISHQLTPYATLVVATGFVLLNVSGVRTTPLLMGVIIFVWFTYSAVPFLQHFVAEGQSQDFGEVQRNFSASVTARVAGNREHELVVYARIIFALALWLLATMSALWRLWRRQRDTAFIVIGLAPFMLVGLQSYGGEIGLRVYLFSLPATAFFVAALFAHGLETWSAKRATLAMIALSLALLPLFLIARYGNERLDYYTKNEYEAVQELYRVAPRGSEFFVVSENLPWRWQRYESDGRFSLYLYLRLYADHLRGTPDVVANTMATYDRPTFLVFTRAQEAFAVYIGQVSPRTITRFMELVDRSPRFRRIYSNPDAVIYRLRPRQGRRT
jgi:hypothetical protein